MNSSMNHGQVGKETIRISYGMGKYARRLFNTGDIYSHPELLVPDRADVTNLLPAYEVVYY